MKRGQPVLGQDPRGADVLAKSLEEGKGLKPLILLLTPKGQPSPSEEALESTNKVLMGSNDAVALAAVIRSIDRFEVSEDKLRKNRVPVLSLIGETDPIKDSVDQLQSVLANLKVVVIPSANHGTAPSNPLFVRSLKQFLAAHPAH